MFIEPRVLEDDHDDGLDEDESMLTMIMATGERGLSLPISLCIRLGLGSRIGFTIKQESRRANLIRPRPPWSTFRPLLDVQLPPSLTYRAKSWEDC